MQQLSFLQKVKNVLMGKLNRLYLEATIGFLYPRIYKKYAKAPVDERKAVFVEIRFTGISNSFQLLYDKLYAETELSLRCHFLREGAAGRIERLRRCVAMLKDVATAKYVFFNDSTAVFARFNVRPETVMTQLWHACGAFKRFGYSTADSLFGASRRSLELFPLNRNLTHITVSSPEVMWAYEEAMNYTRESGVVKPLGCSRTDIFYDEPYVTGAYEALYAKFPAAKGKKVILYAPTFRGRVQTAEAPDVLDVARLREALGEEYVLVVKHHPFVKNRPPIPTDCAGSFALDLSAELSIEELLCVSDICISDYSSLIFEYSLFGRPMLFLAHDLADYFDWRGFYYDYYDLTPGPVVTDTEQVIDFVLHLDERFDPQQVTDFREKFMSACDGHATERIVQTVLGKAYESVKRAHPLPKDDYHRIPKAD